jgi:protocatechuate 3,4-dioxygenase beta subunit
MSKKVVIPAPRKLIVVSSLSNSSLSRRKVLEGFGALALPIVGAACSSDDGSDGGPGKTGGAGGAPGAGTGPTGGTGTGVAGSLNTTGGTGPTAGTSSGGSGTNAMAGTGPAAGSPSNGGMAGSGVTGGTSPGGAPGGGAGAGAGGASGGAGGTMGGSASGGASAGAGGGGGGLIVPPWDNVAMCTVSKTDGAGQGPFMIHDKEKSDDVSLLRQDIRGRHNMNAEEGVELHLHLRILSSKSSMCSMAPVKDAEIYIWHTDGQGFYSGFGMPGEQKPDDPYAGTPSQTDLDNADRFCRGVQLTNADGVVSFRSVFPGWYNGRDVHIHFVALKKDSMARTNRMGQNGTYSGAEHLLTTQFYFDPELTASVHEQYEPYKRRTSLSAYAGAIKADEGGNSGLKAKATLSNNIVTAQLQLVLDPKV